MLSLEKKTYILVLMLFLVTSPVQASINIISTFKELWGKPQEQAKEAGVYVPSQHSSSIGLFDNTLPVDSKDSSSTSKDSLKETKATP